MTRATNSIVRAREKSAGRNLTTNNYQNVSQNAFTTLKPMPCVVPYTFILVYIKEMGPLYTPLEGFLKILGLRGATTPKTAQIWPCS